MKAKSILATYESPNVQIMTIHSEGVLCGSTQDLGGNHDGYTNGGNIDFSDLI